MRNHRNFWDRNAGRYDRFMRKDRAAYEEMYALIRPVVKAKTVLELATGTGLIAKHIVNAAAHIEATPSRMVGRCAVLQGSVADMMFADNWFDAVTAFETVYFWPDLPQCFREVYRVLKVGGTFFICNESNGDTDRDEKWTKLIGGMSIYKDIELKAYLEQAGFHGVQIHKKKSWLCITARK